MHARMWMGSQWMEAINLCKIGEGLNKDIQDDDVAILRRCGDNIISRSWEVIEWVDSGAIFNAARPMRTTEPTFHASGKL